MQSAQKSTVCHACDGYGIKFYRGGFDERFPVKSSDFDDCPSCVGSGLKQNQSGDLCRSPVQSPDAVGQGGNQ